MKLRTLLSLIIILNVVHAQFNQKKYEIVDTFHLEVPYNLLWTPKTITDAGKIRLATTKSSSSHVLSNGFINPMTKKTISIKSSNATNSLGKSSSDYQVREPKFNRDIKAITQYMIQGDTYGEKIYNAEGTLVGDYTMSLSAYEVYSGFPDGRLLRYNINNNSYEILTSNTAPPIKLTDKFDRPTVLGDEWFGMNIYFNEKTQDIFLKTGVIHDGSMAALVFVIDKNNLVLWERIIYTTPPGTKPHLNQSTSGNIFTLYIPDIGKPGSDLLIINRSGQTVLDLQNVKCSPGFQVISSDDKYLVTIIDKVELLVYDLSDGQLVKQSKGSGGRNMLSVDYAAQTEELFLLKRRLEKDKTIIELVILDVNKPDEKYFIGEEIVSFTGYKKPRGKIRVSDDGNNVSVIIGNEFYELSRIDK